MACIQRSGTIKAVYGRQCIFGFSVCVPVAQKQNETEVMRQPTYNPPKKATS